MFRLITFYLIFISAASAQNAKGIFSIVVEGKRSDLSYIKKRSELAMARSTKYCRGSKMPKAQGTWSCKKSGSRVSSCVLEYKCSFVNKSFSRVSETRRIRSELKSIPKSRSKYDITLVHEDRREVMKQLGGGKFVFDSASSSANKYGSQTLTSSSKSYSRSSSYKKNNVKKKKVKKVKPQKKTAKARQIERDELEELAAVKEEDFEVETQEREEEWVLEKKKKTDGREEYQVYKKDEKYKDSKKTARGNVNQWASFALSYISVSDSLENSLATFDAAWTPYFWFSNTWAIRGNLGAHQFQLAETETTVEESFLIYDMGVFGVFKVGGIFAEAGFGLQKWNNSAGDSFNSLTIGGGYIFDYYKLKFIDRIQAGFTSVGNDIGTKEFRLSVGMSF